MTATQSKITWWQAVKHEAWHLFNNKIFFWETACSGAILLCLIFGSSGIYFTTRDIHRYSHPFPPIELTRFDKGQLSAVFGRGYRYWKLVPASGEAVFLQALDYYWMPKSGDSPPVPAEIHWFQSPTAGIGVVATLKVNGEVLGTYEQMKARYELAPNNLRRRRIYAAIIVIISFLLFLRRIVAYRNTAQGVTQNVD